MDLLLATGNAHGVSQVLLGFMIVLFAAKVGGELFVWLKMPAVLGELIAGILLGNVFLTGWHGVEFLKHEPSLVILAEIGVVLLLFEVGIESTVPQMLRLGPTALGVAVVGVIGPTALGFLTARAFLPSEPFSVHLFLGTVLCATSVGITARVLQEAGNTKSAEAKIILGAAVIDDILGLMVLATVSGMIIAASQGQSIGLGSVAWIAGKAMIFLVVAILFGLWLSPRMYRAATRLRSHGLLLPLSLCFCFGLAYLSDKVGLAPIVGAYTAGLILDEVHFRELQSKERRRLEDLLHPVVGILLPVFFVLMGLRVDIRAFVDSGILLFAGVLTVAAILGKQACSLVVFQKGVDRWAIGIGMTPRGEVGLIFAGIGTTLVLGAKAVVSPQVYSACVIMVLLTTLVTPPLLKWRMARANTPATPS